MRQTNQESCPVQSFPNNFKDTRNQRGTDISQGSMQIISHSRVCLCHKISPFYASVLHSLYNSLQGTMFHKSIQYTDLFTISNCIPAIPWKCIPYVSFPLLESIIYPFTRMSVTYSGLDCAIFLPQPLNQKRNGSQANSFKSFPKLFYVVSLHLLISVFSHHGNLQNTSYIIVEGFKNECSEHKAEKASNFMAQPQKSTASLLLYFIN